MVPELDTRRCVSEEAEPRRGVDWEVHINLRSERVSARMLGLEEEWIVRSHVGWGGDRNIFYKGVETSP